MKKNSNFRFNWIIGKITLNIIKQNKNYFEIKLLSTNKNIKILIDRLNFLMLKI